MMLKISNKERFLKKVKMIGDDDEDEDEKGKFIYLLHFLLSKIFNLFSPLPIVR